MGPRRMPAARQCAPTASLIACLSLDRTRLRRARLAPPADHPPPRRSLLSNLSFYPLPGFAVAYIKFDKASSAALAIENLNGAVLNNGRGPKLKVLLAEAPTAR